MTPPNPWWCCCAGEPLGCWVDYLLCPCEIGAPPFSAISVPCAVDEQATGPVAKAGHPTLGTLCWERLGPAYQAEAPNWPEPVGAIEWFNSCTLCCDSDLPGITSCTEAGTVCALQHQVQLAGCTLAFPALGGCTITAAGSFVVTWDQQVGGWVAPLSADLFASDCPQLQELFVEALYATLVCYEPNGSTVGWKLELFVANANLSLFGSFCFRRLVEPGPGSCPGGDYILGGPAGGGGAGDCAAWEPSAQVANAGTCTVVPL